MLTSEQRAELDAVMRKRHGNAAILRRARCVVLWAGGERRVDIRGKLACNDAFVTKWTSAFDSQGLAGLVSVHPGRTPRVPVAKLEARVLNRTLKHMPRDGSTHWSSRKLANELGDVSFSAVQRIWRKHGVRPHRLDTHMVSNDPDFETKAADVIGLYLDPPAHAAVFCVDEKTAIQRSTRIGCCRCRLGEPKATASNTSATARSVFAALNTSTGEVLGKTAARHTSGQFVGFLDEIVATQPPRRDIHVICDNVSSHKTPLASWQSIGASHYTPTYSRLNQVENWFARIQRDVISRGIFSCIKDLDKKLMRYIRQYNKNPKPLKWTFADPARRITADS